MALFTHIKHLILLIFSLILTLLVKFYQFFLRPFTMMLGARCRFEPSCSEYMLGAIRKYGPFVGLWRGTKRLCRCHPFHPGGYDPP